MDKTYFEGYYNTQCFNVLAETFPFVSWRAKTEPSAGSPCYKTERLNPETTPISNKTVTKRNGDIVVYTDIGVLKFWRKR